MSRSLAEEIELLVKDVANNNPAPKKCVISKIYEDNHVDVDIKVGSEIGTIQYRPCLGNPKLDEEAIIIFINGSINEGYVISAIGGGGSSVQSDWSVSDSSSLAFIKNKPDLTIYQDKDSLDSSVGLLGYIKSAVLDNYYTKTVLDGLLTLKADVSDLPTKLSDFVNDVGYVTSSYHDNSKVDKVTGKGLSTNDYTTSEKSKLASLENYDDSELRDLIDSKASSVHSHSINDVSSLSDSLNAKVDKVNGKGLSTVDFTDTHYVHTDNNYTTSEKSKLASLENYDDTDVKRDIQDLESNKANKTDLNYLKIYNNSAGNNGYERIARLTVNGPYVDYPVEFVIKRRVDKLNTKLTVRLSGTADYDPSISSFYTEGSFNDAYIYKSSTYNSSTGDKTVYDLYVRKGSSWDVIGLIRYNNIVNNIKISLDYDFISSAKTGWTQSNWLYSNGKSKMAYSDDNGNVIHTTYATNTALNNKVDKVTGKGLSTEDYTTAEKNKLSSLHNYDDTTIEAEIAEIEIKIPEQATSSNQLADKEFVNSSIATNTAYFRGTYESVAELEEYSGTKTVNDYAFVIIYDEIEPSEVKQYDRYKWTGSAWVFEYTLNNSSFTAQQWATINSNLTSTSLDAYSTTSEMNTAISNYHDSSKQDVISDLESIRSNSSSALQPSDNVSELTNDANYITSSSIIQDDKIKVTTQNYGDVYQDSFNSMISYDILIAKADITGLESDIQDLQNSKADKLNTYTKSETDSAIDNHHDSTKVDVSQTVTMIVTFEDDTTKTYTIYGEES